MSVDQVIASSLVADSLLIFELELYDETGLVVGMRLMSMGRESKLRVTVKSWFNFDCHFLFDGFDRSAVWLKDISVVGKLFERAVVEFEQGALKSDDDVFWSVLIICSIASAVFMLVIKVISPRRSVPEELLEDFKAVTLVDVTALAPSILLSIDVLESLMAVLVVDQFQSLV